MSIAIAIVLPLFSGRCDKEVQVLWKCFPVIAALSSAYAVIEFALGYNFVYTPIYEAVGRPLIQGLAAYRAHGSFGHPLYAASFFSVSFALAFGRWFLGHKGSLLWMIASLAGALVTVSRGALVAAAAAVAIVLVTASMRTGLNARPRYMKAFAFVAVGFTGILSSGVVQGRSGTTEAETSSQVRDRLYPIVLDLAQSSRWLGSGVASSDSLLLHYTYRAFPLENSYLQLLVSLGAPGLATFGIMLLSVMVFTISGRNFAALSALTAFAVAIAGYNAIETLLPLHVLLGLLLIVAQTPDSPRKQECSPAGRNTNADGSSSTGVSRTSFEFAGGRDE